eukprot:5017100-Amphidinium_carterae.1
MAALELQQQLGIASVHCAFLADASECPSVSASCSACLQSSSKGIQFVVDWQPNQNGKHPRIAGAEPQQIDQRRTYTVPAITIT